MAAGDAAAELWLSLPADLLGMVYAKLPSRFDHVRFAAVCTSWRAFASKYPPRPLLPLMILDPRGGDETKCVYCPEEDLVLARVTIPSEAAGGCFVGCYDEGWVVSSDAPLGIVNVFSGAEVVYSPEQKRIIRAQQSTGDLLVMRKIVFSMAPTACGCILAAITDKHCLALCKVDCPEAGWSTRQFRGEKRLVDITFCNGELYGLMRHRDWLVKFEISMNERGAPLVKAVRRVATDNNPHLDGDPEEHIRYIVELRGKLMMVVRNWPWHIKKSTFRVFELFQVYGGRSADTYKYIWVAIKSLGDHAIFLGTTCSKAVYVPEDAHGGVRRNHVYYSNHRCLRRGEKIPNSFKEFLTNSSTNDGGRVYYREEEESINGGVEKITYIEYHVKGGARPPMWLLPPDI